MSNAVMALCWPLQMPPTQKAVLVSLADNASDLGVCWPSITTICERTCFGRTAVIDAIRWLEEKGALKADRTNGRHTAYTITPNTFDQSACRTGPGNGPVRLPDATSPPPGRDQSACRTGPVRQADSNHKEPSLTIKSNHHIAMDLPDWLPAQTWADWVDHRREIKKPLTAKAVDLTLAKLTKLRLAGHNPIELIESAIENRWQGIYPPRAGPNGTGKPSIAQQFSQKTYVGTPDDELPDFLRSDAA